MNSLESIQQSSSHVVLVDNTDKPLGNAEKLIAHQQGWLHRAFSIFILRKNLHSFEILLQQRQHDKYHSGGLWTNTCCSHPLPNEDLLSAGKRRLQEEMGFRLPLTHLGYFIYRAEIGSLVEHELDHVLIGFYEDQSIEPAPEEVMAFRWISLDDLHQELSATPQNFTAWLPLALQHLEHNLGTCTTAYRRDALDLKANFL